MTHDSARRKVSCIVAVAMIVVSACTRETFQEEPKAPISPLTIQEAETPGTKTAFSKEDGVYYSYWSNNDMLRVFFGTKGTHEDDQYHFKNTAENRTSANFVYHEPHSNAPALTGLAAGTYSVMGFYPNSSGISHLNYNGSPYKENATWCLAKVPSTQAPQAAGPDAKADILVMEPFTFEYDGETTSICNTHFTRATAVIRIVVKDEGGLLSGKDIKSLVFEASDSTLAGNAILDLKSGGGFIEAPFKDDLGNNVSKSKSITANYSGAVAASGCEVFLSTVPQVIENNTFTVTMRAGDAMQGRVEVTATLTPGIVEFKAGKITSFKLVVSNENTAELAPFDGEGTNGSPYLITCETDLLKLSQLTNGDDYANWIGKIYKQEKNITLTAENFTPICQTNAFWGTYNGNDKKISGLKISLNATHNVGLFGSISNNSGTSTNNNYGRVMRLTLESPVISTTGASNYVAAVVGLAQGGKIARCHVKGATITKNSNPACGFICGGTTSRATTIIDCSVSASTITANAANNNSGIGGILGRAQKDVTIKKCVVGSSCTISGYTDVGGILGFSPKSTNTTKMVVATKIDSCYVYGNVKGKTQVIGGIVGGAAPCPASSDSHTDGGSILISNCSFIGGEISTEYTGGNAYVGGIFGLGSRATSANGGMEVNVVNCYSRPSRMTAALGGATNWSVGGIMGGMFAGSHVTSCWSDITEAKISAGTSTTYGSIVTQIQPNSNALLDRFHGFIEGWLLPRVNKSMIFRGWTINVEYFSEILHSMRTQNVYSLMFDQLVKFEEKADVRDSNAIKRLSTAYMKLLFPHWRTVEDVNKDEFELYCLNPAVHRRGIIKEQCHNIDPEFKTRMPDVWIK